jgi:predicted metal-binding membrane protein
MWWVMMIAMMIPSATPFVLLYARVMRHAAAQNPQAVTYVSTTSLVAGYLLAWLVFSIAASAIQYLLQHAGVIAPMMLWSQSAVLSAVVLAAAGVYQLSPLKLACLQQCRSPAQFLTQHWRKGRGGALRMGVEHGMWCVGCCWLLMALLFVGGVMNLVWIALLAVLVLCEKLLPASAVTKRLSGALLIVWSIGTLLVR